MDAFWSIKQKGDRGGSFKSEMATEKEAHTVIQDQDRGCRKVPTRAEVVALLHERNLETVNPRLRILLRVLLKHHGLPVAGDTAKLWQLER